jgi:tyrosyl-tRNA synthetase
LEFVVSDPSGGATERPASPARERVAKNAVHLTQVVSRFFTRAHKHVKLRLLGNNKSIHLREILNNLSWWKYVSFLHFLRDIRAQWRMYAMLARDRYGSLPISDPYNLTDSLGF